MRRVAWRLAPLALTTVLLLLAGPGSAAGAPACGERLAGETLSWIVPNAPGGGNDTYARLIEPFWESALGAQIVIRNESGAGGLVGTTTLRDAAPDGTTVGIMDGPGLLMTRLAGETKAPSPRDDFTLLARVARRDYVWATGAESGPDSVEAAFAAAERRPLLVGVRDAGSSVFATIAVSTWLLGVDRRIITGYRGSRAATLAALRGEVDLVIYNFESIRDRIASGDLRLLLQVMDTPSADPLLKGVPLLGGADGVAARRAAALGRDVEAAVADAHGIAAIGRVGRLVAAPRGLEPSLARCLEDSLHDVLADPELRAAAATAKRTLDVGRPDEVRADLDAAASRAERFLPIIGAAIREVRE